MTMPDDRRGSQPMTPWQAWLSMFGLRAPLSGDVTQDITSSIGGQLGLLNINATRAGDPGLEQRIITQVASYGRQLGRLIDHVDRIVTEIQALSRHPETNAEAIRRVREALPEQ